MSLQRPTSRRARERRALALGATAAAAAAGFGTLARASARRDTAPLDDRILQNTAPHEDAPVRKAAHAAAPVGKWYTYVPAALAIAGYLLSDAGATRSRRGRLPFGARSRRGQRGPSAAAVALSSGLAFALSEAFDRWLPQPPAPPGHEDRDKPVFPSGHTFGPTAVGLTAAYVLAREGHARGAIAVPIAATLPLVLGGGRMLDERHWASDVVGGYLGGVAVAGACLAGYELGRR
jgi:membrane-associated phospholipid phosphatase